MWQGSSKSVFTLDPASHISFLDYSMRSDFCIPSSGFSR
nr:MAG TPA: hypothetical protein [Caudoviricetes sp.]